MSKIGRLPARRDSALMARCQETHSSARSPPESARPPASTLRNTFSSFPKDRYQTEVESWRLLQSQNIEFTMKRLREPIEGAEQ
jgi:hypothetical protein